MNIPATLRPYKDIIDEVSDERSTGDGVWVYLNKGLRWDYIHFIHEDTLKECADQLKHNVEPCDCDQCKR